MVTHEFDPMQCAELNIVPDVDRIRLWTDALRSGKYAQARRVLCDGEKYCCLGVACQVAYENGLNITRVASDYPYMVNGGKPETVQAIRYAREVSYLPIEVADWYGLDSRNPWVEYQGTQYTLIQLNDDGAFGFPEIADMIDARYPAVDSELVAA